MGSVVQKCCKTQITPALTPPNITQDNQELNPIEKSSDNKIKRNDFVVLGELGKGGFGRVFLVRSKLNGEKYALKEIRKKLLLNENGIRL